MALVYPYVYARSRPILTFKCISSFYCSKAEVKQTTFALYIRSNEEIVHPFLSAESPVRRAGFSLLSCDLLSYPRHQGTGDVEMDAKKLIDGMRVWSNHTILSGNNYFSNRLGGKMWKNCL